MNIRAEYKEKLLIKAREDFDLYWYLSYIKVSTGEYDKLKELNLTREEIDAFRDIIWMKRKEDLWADFHENPTQSESRKEWSENVLRDNAKGCGRWSFFYWYEKAREEIEKKEGENDLMDKLNMIEHRIAGLESKLDALIRKEGEIE